MSAILTRFHLIRKCFTIHRLTIFLNLFGPAAYDGIEAGPGLLLLFPPLGTWRQAPAAAIPGVGLTEYRQFGLRAICAGRIEFDRVVPAR